MDMQHVVDLILAVGMTVFGWFAREMWSAVKELKADLAHLREEIPKEYAQKDDLEKVMARIDAKLDKLFDKLDAKADKP
jgi:hypothetical protein